MPTNEDITNDRFMPTTEDISDIVFKAPKGPILSRTDVRRPNKKIEVI